MWTYDVSQASVLDALRSVIKAKSDSTLTLEVVNPNQSNMYFKVHEQVKVEPKVTGEIKLPAAYKVDIIESERGWGSKVEDTKYFESKELAMQFVQNYNARNTDTVVPDWYMYAEYRGKVS